MPEARAFRRRAEDAQEPLADTGHDVALNILFLSLFPVILWLFKGSASLAFTAVLLAVMLSGALRLISIGEAAAAAYDAATTARPPRLPCKILGSLLIGAVVLILAGHHFATLTPPLLMGAMASALSVTAFGADPLRHKGGERPEDAARRETRDFVGGLQAALDSATERVAALGEPELARRTGAARDMALRMLRTLSDAQGGPGRLREPAGKFVTILLAEIDRLEADWGSERARFARCRFTAKLDVLCTSLEARLRRSVEDTGRDAVDMQADLLLDRIRHARTV